MPTQSIKITSKLSTVPKLTLKSIIKTDQLFGSENITSQIQSLPTTPGTEFIQRDAKRIQMISNPSNNANLVLLHGSRKAAANLISFYLETGAILLVGPETMKAVSYSPEISNLVMWIQLQGKANQVSFFIESRQQEVCSSSNDNVCSSLMFQVKQRAGRWWLLTITCRLCW